MKKISIEKIVEYKLDKIDEKETVSVNFKDLVYIYKTVLEFRRFFHNPTHYEKKDNLEKFIGDKKKGAFYLANNIYKEIFDKIFDDDTRAFIEEELSSKSFPNYY